MPFYRYKKLTCREKFSIWIYWINLSLFRSLPRFPPRRRAPRKTAWESRGTSAAGAFFDVQVQSCKYRFLTTATTVVVSTGLSPPVRTALFNYACFAGTAWDFFSEGTIPRFRVDISFFVFCFLSCTTRQLLGEIRAAGSTRHFSGFKKKKNLFSRRLYIGFRVPLYIYIYICISNIIRYFAHKVYTYIGLYIRVRFSGRILIDTRSLGRDADMTFLFFIPNFALLPVFAPDPITYSDLGQKFIAYDEKRCDDGRNSLSGNFFRKRSPLVRIRSEYFLTIYMYLFLVFFLVCKLV